MSIEEQDAAIGRVVRERTEMRKQRAMLLQDLRRASSYMATAIEMVRQLGEARSGSFYDDLASRFHVLETAGFSGQARTLARLEEQLQHLQATAAQLGID